MSQGRIDLSKLPAPVRENLQERLDALPADVRQKLLDKLAKVPPAMLAQMLERSAPMLDKVLAGIERAGSAASGVAAATQAPAPAAKQRPKAAEGLYNTTVQRGDRLSLPLGVVVLLIGGLFLVLYKLGLFGG